MSATAEDLRLLVDPSFRCSLALAHGVTPMLLELHLRDGRSLGVSHDPAFRPVLAPCHVRLAMTRAAAGSPPTWLASVSGWSVGGPFVEPMGGGVVSYTGPEGDRMISFATTLTPMVVNELAAELDAGDGGAEDLSVRLRPDSALGATVVDLGAGPRSAAMADLAAALLGASCRQRERVLRAAAR